MNNLEKVQAVLKFADEKFSPSGDGASEMDEWLDGADVLLEDGRYSASQLGMATSMAFYADHVTKSLQERIAELELLLSHHHTRGMNPECVCIDELS